MSLKDKLDGVKDEIKRATTTEQVSAIEACLGVDRDNRSYQATADVFREIVGFEKEAGIEVGDNDVYRLLAEIYEALDKRWCELRSKEDELNL
jgi:hypothetical protein